MNNCVEIITIDGPASSGKGVIAKKVAKKLSFNYLDSGSMYRVIALIAMRNCLFEDNSIDSEKISLLLKILDKFNIQFGSELVTIDNENVTDLLRSERIGTLASIIGKNHNIREYLLIMQRRFAKAPGLVTDGRDMGSIVFPHSKLKVYLTASVEVRAERRFKQLQKFQESGTISTVLKFIIDRDKSDIERIISPLVYDDTYKVLDNSFLTIDESVNIIISWYKELN